jgi:hypothetical protein
MEATTLKEVRPAAEEAGRAPVKVFRIDDVSASIFATERQFRGSPVTFYTVSFSRSYLGSDGKRRYGKTFDADDLERIVHLAEQAGDYLLGLRHAGK